MPISNNNRFFATGPNFSTEEVNNLAKINISALNNPIVVYIRDTTEIDVTLEHFHISSAISCFVVRYKPKDLRMLVFLSGMLGFLSAPSGNLRYLFDQYIDNGSFSYCFSLEFSLGELYFCIYYSGDTPIVANLIDNLNAAHMELYSKYKNFSTLIKLGHIPPVVMKHYTTGIYLPDHFTINPLKRSETSKLEASLIGKNNFLDMVSIRHVVKGNFLDNILAHALGGVQNFSKGVVEKSLGEAFLKVQKGIPVLTVLHCLQCSNDTIHGDICSPIAGFVYVPPP